MRRSFPALACAALLAAGASAQEVSTGSTIGDVTVLRRNVFDPEVPGEDLWIFRVANKIHIKTRDRVITHENLMPPGSRYDPIHAVETERNLRSLGFIRKAQVLARLGASGRTDLDILTQDSWTLKPTVGVGTEGGDNFFLVGLEENNLLGLGKTVGFLHSRKGGKRRDEARYIDPRVWGTWHRLTTLYAKAEEGDEIGARVDRPFFSFEAPYASDVSWARVNRVAAIFDAGDEISEFNQNFHSVRSEAAFRVRGSHRLVQRLHIGTLYERQRFFAKAKTQAGTLPEDRTLSGPILGYSWIQPDYLRETNIDKMDRVEDFNLGNEFWAGVSPTLRSWGADIDRLIFSALMQQGLSLADGRFLLAQIGTQGRLAENDNLENALLFANMNLFWKAWWPFPQTFVAHLEYNNAKQLDGEKQILLGGTTGLRGYKKNSFTGSRSLLLNFENRFFYPKELLHLLYVGAVVFFDVGAAAPEGAPPSLDRFKSDLGAGLRFSGSRSASGVVLRMDVAYALNDGPGRDRWVVSLRAGQAFDIFNSTNRELLIQPDEAVTGGEDKTRLLRR